MTTQCIGEVTQQEPSMLKMIIESGMVRVVKETATELTYEVLTTFAVNVNNNFPCWYEGEIVTVDLT